MLLTNPIDSDKGNILGSTAQRTALAEPRSQESTPVGIEAEQTAAEKRIPDDVTTRPQPCARQLARLARFQNSAPELAGLPRAAEAVREKQRSDRLFALAVEDRGGLEELLEVG
jgi:hypothetical protein